ncbi:MAG: hypothetical protein AVDCRST_MAG87-173 [uncultured Thermomicrobiales bacterium]|uniref:Thioesterase domain-containing protein n=1 Tax=uncultured Thermomicrobiales bacterium TaxID=1645740 RepID=A0A6J4U9E5_9BACT|nr:MAG: hypothetical protein AVDCRST_MAG87-173 [uncultured Thermomicrobiales bacterium]
MRQPRSGFKAHVRVRFHECDPYGHVNNAVYLGYLEQVAIDHAAAAGWSSARLRAEVGAVFVARRHEIEFLLPSFENDMLEVVTWARDISGARAWRGYHIRRMDGDIHSMPANRMIEPAEIESPPRGQLVLRASSEWVLANVERGRPVRIPVHLGDAFLIPAEGE